MEEERGVLLPDDSAQVKAFAELEGRIKKNLTTEREIQWCNDLCLYRYLRARDWDVNKAEHMLLNSLQWRRIYRPDLITAKDVEIELRNEGKMYRGGFDKIGRPIIYMKPAKDNTGVPEREVKVRYLVYVMEKTIRAMPAGVEKLDLLIDFKDANKISGIGEMKISKEILDIMQDHYPERLAHSFICNTPWVFNVFWKMISPFVNANTKRKVLLVKNLGELQQYIDVDALEVDYGGKNEFKYNFEEHWQREDNEFPVERFDDPVHQELDK